ncbi:MAG: hypothetical protein V2B18_13625 [Pseudomonadota bacterium]
MEEDHYYYGFHIGKVVISTLRLLLQKGVLEEKEVLDLLWDAKDPQFPWSKQDIKELLKL